MNEPRGDERPSHGQRKASVPATRDDVSHLFGRSTPLVGMVHLEPLPGAPRWAGSMERVLERARADARALEAGGMDGILVENFGDVPFHPRRVPPETVAAMAVALEAIREEVPELPLGVNALRNDVRAALGLAAVGGAAFLRANVHAGTMFTDQGTVEGRAHHTLRLRPRLAPNVLVLADVLVKHAHPPGGIDPGIAAADLRHRALADVLVVSGVRTGAPTDAIRIEAARRAAPEAPIWVGSGLNLSNAHELLRHADGAIVGSALQHEGRAGTGVDEARVRELVERVRSG